MVIDFEALERKLLECGGIIRLDNGVTIIYEDIPGFGLVRGEIEIRAGSHHEPVEDQGVMHFLEHMVFNGSEKYPSREDQEERASLLGLLKNAETDTNNTKFGIKGSSGYLLEDNFTESFEIFADRVFHPLLREQDIEKERAIIQRERQEREQRKVTDRAHQINEYIHHVLSANNPLFFRDGVGTEETIDAITVETLKRYHSRYYVGDNTLVSLVGDIRAKNNALSTVVRTMQKVPKGVYAGLVEVHPETPYIGRQLVEIPTSPHSTCAIVQIYFQLPDPNADGYATSMLAQVLGGSSHSLLFQNLRERKGLVYEISCSTNTSGAGHVKTGFLTINYYVEPSRIDESLVAVDTCLQAARDGQFRETLIDAAQASYLPLILATLKQPGWAHTELMFRIKAEMNGYDPTGFDMRKAFSITTADVVRAANQYLGENRHIFVLRPE
jgi:predicted Zn-dependent peptidase